MSHVLNRAKKEGLLLAVKAMVACKKSSRHYHGTTWLRQFHRQESPRPPSGWQMSIDQGAGSVGINRRQDGSARVSSAARPDIELGYIGTPPLRLISHDNLG